jgi:hypothetical protein
MFNGDDHCLISYILGECIACEEPNFPFIDAALMCTGGGYANFSLEINTPDSNDKIMIYGPHESID